MDRLTARGAKTPASTADQSPPSSSKPGHKDSSSPLCDKREKLHQRKRSPHPVLHPDVAHAQMEANSIIRFNEDSRPMFSPVPGNFLSDGEESPRAFSNKSSSKEKISFPAIHVEKCEKTEPSYVTSCSPEPTGTRTPESDMELDNEMMSTSQGSSSGCLNVPSPFLHRKSDGRLVLVTQDSGRGLLGSWSRSEGNLPEAVRRSSSTPGGHSHLLDTKYRPDWQVPRRTLRQSSDVALHELRRQGQRSPVTPRRLPARLEPLSSSLSQSQRALSANNLQSP